VKRWAWRDLVVLLGYTAVSFGYWAWRVLPHPGRSLIGSGNDPEPYVWAFAWWPHAIGSFQNPFVTHAVFVPQGVNLTWTTEIPALALAFWPVTLLAGPVVSYNLAAMLIPAVAAFTAYRLCLHLTRSTWAAVVGGYLFGFSSFVLAQQIQGHLAQTGVFLLPLVALVVVRFVEGTLTPRGLSLWLGVLLALQLLISTETATTLSLALVLGLTIAYAVGPGLRPAIRRAVVPVVGGYAVMAVLTAPFLVFAFLGRPGGDFTASRQSGVDLMNALVPSHVNAIAGSWFPSVNYHFEDPEAGLYLGLPTLLIVVLYAVRGWRTFSARFLLICLALAMLGALGTALFVDGHRVMSLPLALARHVPALDEAKFQRLAVYAALAAAVVVALWTARTKGWIYPRPFLLPLLAMGALVPVVWSSEYASTPPDPAFFAEGLSKSCLRPGETIAVFPYGWGTYTMLWQAEAGFRFDLAGGYLFTAVYGAPPLTAFERDQTYTDLTFHGDIGLPTMEDLLGFAGRHRIARFVSVAGEGYPTARQLRSLGPVERIGGVLVAPACGSPPLTSRNLAPDVQQAATLDATTIAYCTTAGNYVTLPASLYPAGTLAGSTRANYVAGQGLTCAAIPPGYRHRGFAPTTFAVPADTYAYYAPA
jgi:hypothetical protein